MFINVGHVVSSRPSKILLVSCPFLAIMRIIHWLTYPLFLCHPIPRMIRSLLLYIVLIVQSRCVRFKLLPMTNQLKPCREQVKKDTNKSQQRTFINIQGQLYKTKPMHENKQHMLHANIIQRYAHCKWSCKIDLLENKLIKPLTQLCIT